MTGEGTATRLPAMLLENGDAILERQQQLLQAAKRQALLLERERLATRSAEQRAMEAEGVARQLDAEKKLLEEELAGLRDRLQAVEQGLGELRDQGRKRAEAAGKELAALQTDIRRALEPGYSRRTKENLYARFLFPWAAVEPGSRIVIYGGGIVGKTFLEQVAGSGYCHVVAVCDKDSGKTGIQEAPVITVQELARMRPGTYDLILIAIEKRSIALEIREDLLLAGLPTDKVKWLDPARR